MLTAEDEIKLARRLFSTADGKAYLDVLKRRYCGVNLRGKDEAATNFNIGAYSVVATIVDDLTNRGDK